MLPLAAGPFEPAEDSLLVLGRDPDTVVAHHQLHDVGGGAPFDLDSRPPAPYLTALAIKLVTI